MNLHKTKSKSHQLNISFTNSITLENNVLAPNQRVDKIDHNQVKKFNIELKKLITILKNLCNNENNIENQFTKYSMIIYE